MVLKVRIPPLESWNQMIEGILPNRYGLRRAKLSRYLSYDQAKDLFPKLNWDYLVRSKTVYAIDYNGVILIHPDSFLNLLKRKLQCFIKAVSKET